MRVLNLDPHPDTYLPDRRARREVPPRFISKPELQAWREPDFRPDVEVQVNLRPLAQEQLPATIVAPAPPSQKLRLPATVCRTRKRWSWRYLVAWRDELGQAGQEWRVSVEAAIRLAEPFERPRAWALVIDLADCSRVVECGTPWQELQHSRERKPPVREQAGLRAEEATACGCS